MEKLYMTEYTDPMCVWCYGMEPAVRKLEFLNPGRIEIRHVMGLLLKDVRDLIGDGDFAGVRLEQIKMQMTEHFMEAAAACEMPVSVENMKDRAVEDFSSYTVSLAFEAMRQFGEARANIYLRRLRDAALADELHISDKEVLVSLAEGLGIYTKAFAAALDSAEAKEALRDHLALCKRVGVSEFPTIILEYKDKTAVLRGYMTTDDFDRAVKELTGDGLRFERPMMSMDMLAAFVSKYGRVAEKEIQTLFALNSEQTEQAVDMLADSERFKREYRGSSFFVRQI